MKKIELEIIALSHSITQSQSYAVVLGEKKPGNRRLPIVIGGFEAQAIAVAIENMSISRPLTHDLIKNLCGEFDIQLKEVLINNLKDGIFFSKLICESNGKTIEIDSRTSDALALAVRFGCTVYTYEFIMDQAGIILEEFDKKEGIELEDVPAISNDPKADNKMSLAELQAKLDDALNKEDYEEAARIRDEMDQRAKEDN